MSIFGPIIGAIKTVVQGIRQVPIGTLLMDIVAYIPGIIQSIEKIWEAKEGGFSTEEKKEMIDSALIEFDAVTGAEGLNLIPGMPRDKQEMFCDHFKELVRVIAYNKAGVEGYVEGYVE